ncbi:Soluble lytic murein transglycosylase [Marinospirillum celere]|uniref:Soluble lytic murein transglycosylase n=1 Tax=Marinospirillum celere TaxID=1122252 RepID=A0A1I1E825_9GAMM|nr:membrane-bound lytic murein transglycosylase MltC [Marinospirillum celere]SFB81113.1 Soluble lytic murein transglycosylase [Marinospirillum celere]
MTFSVDFNYLRLPALLAALILIAGCQSSGQTSSHVSVGSVVGPDGRERPQARPQPLETPSRQVRQQEPAPPPAQPGRTRVEILPANPEQGVPLGDDTEVEIDSLQPAPLGSTQRRPNEPEAEVKEEPAEEPLPGPISEITWLERYPNLAQDLQNYQEVIERLETEVRQYREQLGRLREQVQRHWGEEATLAATAHQFVKYTDAYQSRGAMDFEEGTIVVETVDQSNPRQHLKEAIVTTLLTPYDADNPELYTDKQIDYSGPALLAGQVRDHEGVPVRWEWRANRYADYLIENEIQEIRRGGKTIYRVEIPLVANHNEIRGHQYENLIRDASRRYDVDEALIYAIMETESHFNPYAMSHIPAYGLMQVVPSTAGRDVYQRIRQRNDQPNQSTLFNPAENIDIGTAYITILRDIYLKDIRHPKSKELAIISAYNGGAGNVLRTFHRDRSQAVAVINQLSPQQVYDRLHRQHPRSEARGYIKKVTEALDRYRALASAQ